MHLARDNPAFVLLRLQNFLRQVMHLLGRLRMKREHLIERLGQPIESLVAQRARARAHVQFPRAHLIHGVLQMIERLEREFQDDIVDHNADRQSDHCENRNQFVMEIVGETLHVPDRNRGACERAKSDNRGICQKNFLK